MVRLPTLADRAAALFDSVIDRLDHDVGKKNLFVALLPVMILLCFPVAWSPNEENYFLLAHRRISPEEFSVFHAAFDHSNARFLIEYILGLLIDFFGYDAAHSIARITMAILYSMGLSILFSALGLSVLKAVATIAIFYFGGQQLLGGEWLFGGVEGKTFAYAAVMGALGVGLRGRWLIAAVLLSVATYFHFLVGGFWIIGLSLLALLQSKSPVVSFRMLAIYTALVSPLVIVIALEQFSQLPQMTGLTPDQIYAMRGSHHIAPFFDKWQLWAWSDGIIATAVMAIAFLVLIKRTPDSVLPLFVFLLLVYLLLGIVLSFVDRNTNILGKFYLFRPSSLILLLSIATVFSIAAKNRIATQLYVLPPALVVLIAIFLWGQVKIKVEDYFENPMLVDFAALVSAIDRESEPGEIVLVQPKNDMGYPYVGLPRRLPRPTLVSWKFTPSNPRELLRWHNLIEFRKDLFDHGCKEKLSIPVRLLLVFDDDILDSVKSCGEIVWSGDGYSLVRVGKEFSGE